jgi:hypothetical protein
MFWELPLLPLEQKSKFKEIEFGFAPREGAQKQK